MSDEHGSADGSWPVGNKVCLLCDYEICVVICRRHQVVGNVVTQIFVFVRSFCSCPKKHDDGRHDHDARIGDVDEVCLVVCVENER